MQLAVGTDMLDHVDRVPIRLGDDVVDRVGAVFDERADRVPAAAIVGAEKRTLQSVPGPGFLLPLLHLGRVGGSAGLRRVGHLPGDITGNQIIFLTELVDRIDRENPADHHAD